MELLNAYKSCGYTVCTDTRSIVPGSLFIALKGDNFNGNKFAAEALKKGAKMAVVDEKEYATSDDIILVEDGLKALQGLAHDFRKEYHIPVLGITGSNGKTTAKELIYQTLSRKFNTHATPGNFNNHIGLPLTILSMPRDCEFLILEMGDNHPGEIALLSQIGAPTHGLVTNVGKDHIEGFGSFEANKMAKKELFDYLEETGGTAFVPSFETDLASMSKGVADRIFFGGDQDKYSLKFSGADPFVSYSRDGREIVSKLIGEYNIKNMEMANCIASHFEVGEQEIDDAISSYNPQNNRSQFIEQNGHRIFLDAYNANPSSVELALQSFAKQTYELPKLAILGDMLELGAESAIEHQNIVQLLNKLQLDAWIVGSEFGKCHVQGSVTKFPSRNEVIDTLNKKILPPHQILIKGSRGIRLEEVLPSL